MRRRVAVAALLVVIGSGCGRSSAQPTAGCQLRPVSPAGEVTFVAGGRLIGVDPAGQGSHCLARLGGMAVTARWAPGGDRLLVDNRSQRFPGGRHPTGFTGVDQVAWSRPAGSSLLAVTPGGALIKRPTSGGPARDITFLNRHESAIYHPGGQAIVSVGFLDGYGIYLADNTGKPLATLARSETARHIGPLTWTAEGDLVFAAQHDDRWDIHRLVLATGRLSTLGSTGTATAAITDLVASPFASGDVAWRQRDCDAGTASTTVFEGGNRVALPPAVGAATPLGWLPGGALELQRPRSICGPGGGRGDVYTFNHGTAIRLGVASRGVALRVALPPGPRLPATLPSDAPI